MVVEGCGHVGGGVLGGQRVLTLSTECAGARERIVHMSTALPPPRGPIDLRFSPWARERA